MFHQTIARFLLITVLVASSFSCTSSAKIDDNSTKTTVYYAGFGFMGRFDNIAEKFPHAARLNQQKGRQIGRLTAYFTEQLKQQNFNKIVVNFNSVDQNRNRPLMLAMSVERETLSLDRGNNPIVEISAQLLFFDYESRVLLGNLHIPVAFKGIKGADQYVIVKLKTPKLSKKDKDKLRDISESENSSFFDKFKEALQHRNLTYTILRGSNITRMNCVIEQINQYV